MSGIWAESPFRAKVSVAPTEYPVSVAEAKLQCRVDSSVEDSVFTRLIASCTDMAAQLLGGKQIVSATRILYLSAFPCGRRDIAIPYPPLTAISSITYVDTAGASQTWSSAQYQVDTVSEPGRVLLHPDYSWPSTQAGILNAVTITYTCGYGAASAVPNCVKDAILSGVAYKFEHRGDDEIRTNETVEALMAGILSPETMMVA